MRKVLISLLLATTIATPALAAPQDSGAGDRQERSQARQERQAERSQARQDRAEARQQAAQVREDRPQVRQERFEPRQEPAQVRDDRAQARQQRFDVRQQPMDAAPQRMRRSDTPAREVERYDPRANVNARGRPTLDQRQDTNENVANWQRDRRNADRQAPDGRWDRNRVRVPVGARPDRSAPPPETAYHQTRNPDWRTDWRRDHRYDWRNYRQQHRSIFRLGIYYDPFGWNYQRYGIGWRLWPSYYSSSYWLSDPYMYRLPYAPWPYKWVRYYDDALLVNIYSGQVVDVMYDFFW